MRQPGVPGEAAGFGARDAEGSVGMIEFQVGQQFQDKDDALLSVKTYSIHRGVQYKVVESDYRRYVGKCSEFGNGCTWLIRLSLRQHKGIWEVKRADASISIKVLLNATASHYGFRPTYRRVWMAKQKAVALIYGDWDESYNELPRWVLGVQVTIPGSIAVLRTSPVRVGGQLDESQDGNSNILPVAFALVEGENAESWSFFLSHLRQHVTPQPGLLVISDRHNGIKAALEAPDGGWLPPATYRAFCIRHVAANFALTFKGKDARRLLVNASYAKTEVEFHYWFDILRLEDPAMCEWANRIEYSLWTQYCDEGRRFGHMTTNISECVNSILKGVRNFPTARCFTVTLYDRDNSEYTVAETTPTGSFSLGSYRVSLGSQTCDCGYFQALHFPCPHALACCAYSRVTWHSYVHPVYRLSNVFSVYQMGFRPPIPEGFWPPYDGPTVIPDPNKWRAKEGRPRSTRIRTNMDEADPNRPKRCGLCRLPGHTRRSCPQVGGSQGGQ
ncbi:uncharacterized protein [Arachis hypogaea]|uniref:uncharacterized protein n=1 Tax=Arachis hypogaea TaxID=3818 RepID=UPI000DECCB02|nr:uncharacterized protein LOC112794959 [Arachis hypogaea]